MAKVEYINSILSGKLAGSVYSRNRAGAYVRQWVRPINPRTIAQQNARTNFGLSANRYHTLSNSEKANWNAFSAFYNPKGVTMPSSLSGFNVYTAMSNTALNAQDNTLSLTIKKNGTGSALTHTENDFTVTNTAPGGQLISTVATNTGFVPLTVLPADLNINVSESGSISGTLNINVTSDPAGETGVTNPLTDTHSVQYGFVLYMSNGVQQAHNFKKNEEIQKLGSIRNFDLMTAPTAIRTYEIGFVGSVNPGDYQAFPNAGEIVQITLYQVGINGMLNKVVSLNTAIQS